MEAVHLWTSDSDGCVHVLFNARSSKEDVTMKWREGDGLQKAVVCGKGVVCGIDLTTSCLSARTGVEFDSPLGKKWSVSNETASKLAVGCKYLAIVTDNGCVKTSPVPSLSRLSRDKLELNLQLICTPPKELVHVVMDSSDVLYGVTSHGEVYVYRGVADEDPYHQWEFFSKPPPVARRGGFLSSLFSSSKNLFICVAMSNEQIFFLRNDPQEIWQLVISEVVFGGPTHFKSSWNSFKFKDKSQKLSLIAGSPTNSNELFGVTDDGNTIVCLDLQGRFVSVSEMPFHGCGDIRIMSLSTCHLVQEETPAINNTTNTTAVSSLYPKLPKLDACCENGECPSCSQGGTMVITLDDPDWDKRYREQLAFSIAQWRRGQEYHLPRLLPPTQLTRSPSTKSEAAEDEVGRRRGRKRAREEEVPYWNEAVQVTPPTKRPPRAWHKDIPRRHLLEGIDILIKNERVLNVLEGHTFDLSHVSLLSALDLQQLNHSFYLEEQVAANSGNKLLSSFKMQWASVQTESQALVQTESQASVQTESQAFVQTESQASVQTESQTNSESNIVPGQSELVISSTSPNLTRYYTAKNQL